MGISHRNVACYSNIMLVMGVCMWLGGWGKNGDEIEGKNGVLLKRQVLKWILSAVGE